MSELKSEWGLFVFVDHFFDSFDYFFNHLANRLDLLTKKAIFLSSASSLKHLSVINQKRYRRSSNILSLFDVLRYSSHVLSIDFPDCSHSLRFLIKSFHFVSMSCTRLTICVLFMITLNFN
jgi:hypothetical protein